MRPIATGVARSVVCVTVCVLVTRMCCPKMAESIEYAVLEADLCRPRESCIRWGQDSPAGMGNFGVFRPTEKHWESAAMYAAKRIIQSSITTAAADCNAFYWSVSHHVVRPPPCDAAFRQNSSTTCFYYTKHGLHDVCKTSTSNNYFSNI